MEQVEFEDDERYILYEHHKDTSRQEALRLLQLMHSRNRVIEELEKLKEGTQEREKID
jgi:hypothetical protein